MKKMALIITSLLVTLYVRPVHIEPTIRLSSTDFSNGQRIPVICTGEGKNVSPHLSWKGISRSVIGKIGYSGPLPPRDTEYTAIFLEFMP